MGNGGGSTSTEDAGDSDGGGAATDDDIVDRDDGVRTEFEARVGDGAIDAEGNVSEAVVVVDDPEQQANEVDVPWDDDADTLAEYGENQNYPEDDDVLTVANESDLDDGVDGWEQMDAAELAAAVDDGNVDTMDMPRSRLADPTTEDAIPAGNLPDAIGNEVDYERVVADMDGTGDVDTEAVSEAFERHLDTETVPGSDETRMEAVIEDVDTYTSTEDVIEDARESWLHDKDMAVDNENGDPWWAESVYDDQHEPLNEAIEAGETIDADRINVSDLGDSDGSVSAMIAEENGDYVVPSGTGGWLDSRGRERGVENSLEKALKAADDDAEVVITDLAPQDTNRFVEVVKEHGGDNPIKVRDHHDWDDEAVEAVEDSHPESEVAIDGDANSAAEIYWEEDVDEDSITSSIDGVTDEEYRQNLRDSVEVAGIVDSRLEDHDDWDDASYMRSAQYHYVHDNFTEALQYHGQDFHHETDMGREIAEMNLASDVQSAVAIGETAHTVTDEETGRNVGFAFAGNGDRSAIGSALHEEGADFGVLVTDITSEGDDASGGGDFDVKVSFRATEDAAVADTVPAEFGGGGRDNGQAGSAGSVNMEGVYDGDTAAERKEAHQNQRGEPALDWAEENIVPVFREKMQESEGE